MVSAENQTRQTYKPLRAKLIFNPVAGISEEAPFRLSEIIMEMHMEMQSWNIIPEVHLVGPESHLPSVVSHAVERGIRLIVISGGDGTIENAMGPLVGTGAVLGIIPTGTRNNIAISLGIPGVISEAVALLRQGTPKKIDVGRAECGRECRWFLETSSVGLVPALYPSADDIQHGNLGRIADFLSKLVTSQTAEMSITLDDGQEIHTQSHLALAANMPYFGPNFQMSEEVSFQDGLLDLFIFSELNKLELMSYAVQMTAGAQSTDTRILHYRVRRMVMDSNPKMPVMADGFALGDGKLTASIASQGLSVMANLPPTSNGEDAVSEP
jgi:diacylglycerol kinase (ATP)